MKTTLTRTVLLLSCLLLLCSWGFFAHKKIARLAVFTLPSELIGFYKSNIRYITENAVNPDKRRHLDPLEGQKHYLDADYFGISPFDSIPPLWKDAVNKYSQDTLLAYGTVPWAIERSYNRLVNAFTNKDSSAIIKTSADLCHYIADAHVPLHTSMNYNGQLTGQTGIHSFWESRLPELYADSYNFYVGKAHYIDDPLTEAWKIVKETFTLLDSTLITEKRISKNFPSDRKFTYSERNNKVIRQYSEEYSKAYHDALSGMVENQMRKAIFATGCFWYSAWVDAGRPNLRKLNNTKQSAEEKKMLNDEEKSYLNENILGRPDH